MPRARVVLPHPDSPTTATNSPPVMTMLTPRKAALPSGYTTSRSVTTRTGASPRAGTVPPSPSSGRSLLRSAAPLRPRLVSRGLSPAATPTSVTSRSASLMRMAAATQHQDHRRADGQQAL